jgi:hypothetical protein
MPPQRAINGLLPSPDRAIPERPGKAREAPIDLLGAERAGASRSKHTRQTRPLRRAAPSLLLATLASRPPADGAGACERRSLTICTPRSSPRSRPLPIRSKRSTPTLLQRPPRPLRELAAGPPTAPRSSTREAARSPLDDERLDRVAIPDQLTGATRGIRGSSTCRSVRGLLRGDAAVGSDGSHGIRPRESPLLPSLHTIADHGRDVTAYGELPFLKHAHPDPTL